MAYDEIPKTKNFEHVITRFEVSPPDHNGHWRIAAIYEGEHRLVLNITENAANDLLKTIKT